MLIFFVKYRICMRYKAIKMNIYVSVMVYQI
jgi:hypothetical protein